jgi:hypothetical protein
MSAKNLIINPGGWVVGRPLKPPHFDKEQSMFYRLNAGPAEPVEPEIQDPEDEQAVLGEDEESDDEFEESEDEDEEEASEDGEEA